MTTQPEWFNSSLAQSAAAIVGLIAAVFGVRMIEHFGRISGAKAELDARLFAVRERINARVDALEGYGPGTESEIELDGRALSEGLTERVSEVSVDWEHGVRPGRSKPYDIKSTLAAHERYLELWPRVMPLYQRLDGAVSEVELAVYAERLRQVADEIGPRDMQQPGAMMRSDADALEDVRVRTAQFRATAYPKPYWFIVGLMVVFSLAGIIWPLAMLVTSAAQRAMLTLFSLALLGTVALFAALLLSLRYVSTSHWRPR